jgi:hypothetical protein
VRGGPRQECKMLSIADLHRGFFEGMLRCGVGGCATSSLVAFAECGVGRRMGRMHLWRLACRRDRVGVITNGVSFNVAQLPTIATNALGQIYMGALRRNHVCYHECIPDGLPLILDHCQALPPKTSSLWYPFICPNRQTFDLLLNYCRLQHHLLWSWLTHS